jgi:hypothetical protein
VSDVSTPQLSKYTPIQICFWTVPEGSENIAPNRGSTRAGNVCRRCMFEVFNFDSPASASQDTFLATVILGSDNRGTCRVRPIRGLEGGPMGK